VPTSLQAVEKRVGSSGVSQEALSLAHIKQIVNRLIFDCKVRKKKRKAIVIYYILLVYICVCVCVSLYSIELSTNRQVEEVSVVHGPRFPDPGPYYRSAAAGISHYDSFTSMPVHWTINNNKKKKQQTTTTNK
jgi:hypothetical protein